MASASSWALPVAIGGVILLIREAKTAIPEAIDYAEDKVNEGIERVTEASTEALNTVAQSGEYYGRQYYEAENERARQAVTAANIAAAEAITAGQLSGATLQAGQRAGCVTGSLGAYCGKWQVSQLEASDATPADSCHVIGTGGRGGFTKYFVGTYCRDARAVGLVGPRGTISGYTEFNMRHQGWI